MGKHAMSGYGRVVTFTTVARAPEQFLPPYILAVIELREGFVLFGRVRSSEKKISIGQQVKYLLSDQFGLLFETA